jgi:hypothetical protein
VTFSSEKRNALDRLAQYAKKADRPRSKQNRHNGSTEGWLIGGAKGDRTPNLMTAGKVFNCPLRFDH